MPRVNTRTKSKAGRERSCGRCGHKIEPGETYYSFSFRYGGTHYRCKDHYPKRSELTQSRKGEVYSAIEDAEDTMSSADTVQDIIDAVQGVTDVAQELADDYRNTADEHFGGGGPNAELADEMEDFVNELEGFQPDGDDIEGEAACDDCEGTGEIEVDCDACEGEGFTDGEDGEPEECEKCEGNCTASKQCETCEGSGQIDNSDELSEAIENARMEAEEVLSMAP